jgi:hypothetical protein
VMRPEFSLLAIALTNTVFTLQFMLAYSGTSKKSGVYADETFLPIRKQSEKFLHRREKRGANKEVLVRGCGHSGLALL